MTAKNRIKKYPSIYDYNDYVPGWVSLGSEQFGWDKVTYSEFTMPGLNLGAPSSAVCESHYILGYRLTRDILPGEFSLNDKNWSQLDMHKGLTVFLPPENAINWRWWPTSEDVGPVNISVTGLSSSFVKQFTLDTLDMEPGLIEASLHNDVGKGDPFIAQLILAMKGELEQGNPCGRIYSETAAQMLALHLISKYCSINNKICGYSGGFSKQDLRKISDYVKGNLRSYLSLGELASLVGLSDYHFLRLFKKSLGETPLQYIIRLRMEYAERLLRTQLLSVMDVALAVGYENVSHFINLFKRHTGVTPSQYRKNI